MAFLTTLLSGAARARAGMLSGRQAGEAESRKRGIEDAEQKRAEKKLEEDIEYRLLQQQLRQDQLDRQRKLDEQAATARAETAARLAAQLEESKRANQAREQAARERNRIARERARGGSTPDPKAKLTQLGQQIDDTRSDLSMALREAPRRPAFFLSESDSLAFEDKNRSSRSVVEALQARSDSLNRERDVLAAGADQRPSVAAPSEPPAIVQSQKRTITRDQYEYLREKVGMTDEQIAERYIVQ